MCFHLGSHGVTWCGVFRNTEAKGRKEGVLAPARETFLSLERYKIRQVRTPQEKESKKNKSNPSLCLAPSFAPLYQLIFVNLKSHLVGALIFFVSRYMYSIAPSATD